MSKEDYSFENFLTTVLARYRDSIRGAIVLPLCCVCGLIRDDRDSGSEHPTWVTLRAYRDTHDIPPSVPLFTHTYCPECFANARDTARRHLRNEHN